MMQNKNEDVDLVCKMTQKARNKWNSLLTNLKLDEYYTKAQSPKTISSMTVAMIGSNRYHRQLLRT